MRSQRGNFLLQALLALALIVAFMPFFTRRLLSRDMDARMYAVTTHVETAQTAARIYLRENLDNLKYDVTTISGDEFADTLEPYGLPLGFVARTAFGQDITLVITKSEYQVSAYLQLGDANMSEIQRAELVKRIGFYASDGDDGNIYVIVPLHEIYSDVVRRREKNIDDNGFLSDLDMGGFGLENGGAIIARNGQFETLQSASLSLFGAEDGRKIRNKIDSLIANKSVFQSAAGESALTVTRGTLGVTSLSARTIAKFGDTGNFTADAASVYDFSMTAGRTGFTGPAKWDVRGNVMTDNISFSTERLEISSFINASRGQDVFVSDDLEYSAKSGIEAGIIRATNITLRDQISSVLVDGQTGAVVLDIRPAGTSMLPDVLVDTIDNDALAVISKPDDDAGDVMECKSIIAGLNGRYNAKSLSQNIICRYVFWQRLEKRIDIKKCLLDGKSDC